MLVRNLQTLFLDLFDMRLTVKRGMDFLAQKVEHQRTKLKVAGSSPAEVLLSKKCCFILGLVALDLHNHYV